MDDAEDKIAAAVQRLIDKFVEEAREERRREHVKPGSAQKEKRDRLA